MHCSHSALSNKGSLRAKRTMNIHVWAGLHAGRAPGTIILFFARARFLPLRNAVQVPSALLRSIELSQEKTNVWRILKSAVRSNQSDCKVSIIAAD